MARAPMKNATVSHITEGELRIVQDGKTITAKKNHVWTGDKGTKEQAFNDGKVAGVMRITDLMG
jgi:ethanolamine utilization protein EutQ (cupin superfamily)